MITHKWVKSYTRKWRHLLARNRELHQKNSPLLKTTISILNKQTGEVVETPFEEKRDFGPKQKDFLRVKYYAENTLAEQLTGGAENRVFHLLRGHCKEENHVFATKRGVEKRLNLAKRTVHLAFKRLIELNIIRPDPTNESWWYIDPSLCWVGYTESWTTAYGQWLKLLDGQAPLATKETKAEGQLRRIK